MDSFVPKKKKKKKRKKLEKKKLKKREYNWKRNFIGEGF